MLLTILIIALSTMSAPLASGRPTTPSPASPDSRHLSAEPGTLLGRRYVVQEHHEPSRLPRANYAGYATPSGYRTAEAPRHSKPFAQFLAERSRRADPSYPIVAWSPNYVSHVGPPPPHMQPVQPAGRAAPPVGAVPARNVSQVAVATSASNTTSSAIVASHTPKKSKGKSKSLKATHDGGK
ncbi:hypothetical protein C8Q80DRAFT_691463 [Daedaleopsis nitida]|nr:hypothetical protein C8Q80DRAFT_691463 [Daedaleopsis nitida]